MDEPTSSFSVNEIDNLLGLIKNQRNRYWDYLYFSPPG